MVDEAADLAELNRAEAIRTWSAHPAGCDCPSCTYVDHHLDDDDDQPDTFGQYATDVASGRRAGEQVWP